MPSRINNTGLSFGDIKANSKRRGQGFAFKRDSRPAAVRRGLYYLLAIIHIEGPSVSYHTHRGTIEARRCGGQLEFGNCGGVALGASGATNNCRQGRCHVITFYVKSLFGCNRAAPAAQPRTAPKCSITV